MSFSDNIKIEIQNKKIKKKCCIHSFLYGILLGSKAFSNNTDAVIFRFKGEETAIIFSKYILNIIGIKASINYNSDKNEYILEIDKKNNLNRIYKTFHLEENDLANKKLSSENLKSECCLKAFFMGLFVSCAYVSDPQKSYHLEFNIAYESLSLDILQLMNSISDLNINPLLTKRHNNSSIYLKNHEQISDLLTYLGAKQSAMQLMQTSMVKDMRNYVNRTTNFETANISKTAAAAARHIKAINIIKNKKGLDFLEDDLKELAILRLNNPQLTLNEINKKLEKPLSKSGLYHRFNKIIGIAKSFE